MQKQKTTKQKQKNRFQYASDSGKHSTKRAGFLIAQHTHTRRRPPVAPPPRPAAPLAGDLCPPSQSYHLLTRFHSCNKQAPLFPPPSPSPARWTAGIWEAFCCFNWGKPNKTTPPSPLRPVMISRLAKGPPPLFPRGTAIRHPSSEKGPEPRAVFEFIHTHKYLILLLMTDKYTVVFFYFVTFHIFIKYIYIKCLQ